MLERELRVAGVGVVDQQPLLVMAGRDWRSRSTRTSSRSTRATSARCTSIPTPTRPSVSVLRTSERRSAAGDVDVLSEQHLHEERPASSATPRRSRTDLAADSTSTYTNEYILWRRVNARPPRMVARGIYYRPGDDTLFRYFKADTLGNADRDFARRRCRSFTRRRCTARRRTPASRR